VPARPLAIEAAREAAAACGTLESLAEAERHQVRERCLGALEGGRGDGEWVVRYAVAVGLEGLALPLPPAHPHSDRAEASLVQLQDPEREDTLVVRLRAGVALKRLNAR
jgi:phycocyanobilin lyase beta subunit